MNRLLLLVSVAAITLTAAPIAPGVAQDAAAIVVIVPEPPAAPRGLLGGLFKRKQRSPETVIVAPDPADTPTSVGAATPIDLVPTAAPQPAATPGAPRPALVVRRVPDAEMPLPRRNPRRSPGAEEAVDVAVLSISAEAPETTAADAPRAFEPAVPPPATAASEPVVVLLEADVGDEAPDSEAGGLAVLDPAGPAADAVAAEPAGPSDPEEEAAAPAIRVVGPGGIVPAGAILEREPGPQEISPIADQAQWDAAAEADVEARMAAEKLVAAAYATTSPRALVDLLARTQDAIATGSVAAVAAQRRIRARIDDVFADAAPEVWQEPANAIAAVAYVLSGGTPDVLRGFAELEPRPAVDERLTRGALAYVQGKRGEAAGMLLDIDIEKLPARINGQVAMAQAALLVESDPRGALARLDRARLVAPGTLVEEAAIRRSLFIVDQLGDDQRFERLVRQYLERFRHSIYAGNFRYRFAAALTRSPVLDDPAQFGRLDTMLAQLGPDAQRGLYLTVASAAVVAGRMDAGAYAAAKAFELASPGGPDQARARLYRAAATVVDPETFVAAEEDLAAINRSMLQPADVALLDAVSRLAASVNAGSDVAAMVLEPFPEPLPDEEPPEPDPLLERARALSDDIDLLLASAS